MTKPSNERVSNSTSDLLAAAIAEERRLVRREAASEKQLRRARAKLAKAVAELEKATIRFQRREQDVIDAEDELRARQAERMRGPQPDSAEVPEEIATDERVDDSSPLPEN